MFECHAVVADHSLRYTRWLPHCKTTFILICVLIFCLRWPIVI